MFLKTSPRHWEGDHFIIFIFRSRQFNISKKYPHPKRQQLTLETRGRKASNIIVFIPRITSISLKIIRICSCVSTPISLRETKINQKCQPKKKKNVDREKKGNVNQPFATNSSIGFLNSLTRMLRLWTYASSVSKISCATRVRYWWSSSAEECWGKVVFGEMLFENVMWSFFITPFFVHSPDFSSSCRCLQFGDGSLKFLSYDVCITQLNRWWFF